MFFKIKNNKFLLNAIIFFILVGCQLQEPRKNHGILFLENRSKQLEVSSNNKNDVIQLLGNPHTKSINNEENWIYIERVLSKGSFHKLGQNVLATNNVLVLEFDKFGILQKKNFLNKEDLNKIKFSNKITENNLSKKSFVQSFLSSIRAKMYGNRK